MVRSLTPSPTAAITTAPWPIFAVDSDTGHLDEIESFHNPPMFGSAITVDSGDWRGYRDVFAAREGPLLLVYTVTEEGHLRSHRQSTPGSPLDPPVQVGESLDWSEFGFVLVPHFGAIHAADGRHIRTFEHTNASSNGTQVRELLPLFVHYVGEPITSAHWGSFGESNNGLHFRIWKSSSDDSDPKNAENLRVSSGYLPTSITRVVGSEPFLYGINEEGSISLLQQDEPPEGADHASNPAAWREVAIFTGSYSRVIVPSGPRGTQTVPYLNVPGPGTPPNPYEWQVPSN